MYVRGIILALLTAAFTVLPTPTPAQATFTGLDRVTPFTATTSDPKTLTAACPAGKQVIGMGGDTTGANGRVLIDRIRPNAGLTSVSLHANEDRTGTAASWYLQAFIVCAPAPAGLELIASTTASSSASAKSVVATCPSGKSLLGAGFEISGAAKKVLIGGLTPSGTLDNVTVVAAEDESGTTASWSLTAYATCAPAPAGLQRVVATGPSDSTSPKVTSASCPTGKSVIGVLGTIIGTADQIVLDSLLQDIPLTSANIAAAEDLTGTSVNWSLRAYAICVSSTVLVASPPARQSGSGLINNRTCPAGKLPAGVGGDTTAGFGQLGLHAPQARIPRTERGLGRCARRPLQQRRLELGALRAGGLHDPLTGQEVVAVSSPTDSASEKPVTASCPAGKRVIGAGGVVGPENFPNERFLTGVVPNAGLTTVAATAHEHEDGYDQTWTVTAYAVCAPAPAGICNASPPRSPVDSEEFSQASASCPPASMSWAWAARSTMPRATC